MLKSDQLLKTFCVAAISCIFILSITFTGNAGELRKASGTTTLSAQPTITPGNAVQLKPASLKIGNLSISPVSGGGAVPIISIGSMVTFVFTIENVGLGKVPPGKTYSLAGNVLSGSNPCPLASSTGLIPELEPGSSKTYTFIGITGAKTGTYRLMVTSSFGSQGGPAHVDFTVPMPTVTPELKPQKMNISQGFTDPGTLKGFTPQPDPPGKI